jgi:hypothetical protein
MLKRRNDNSVYLSMEYIFLTNNKLSVSLQKNFLYMSWFAAGSTSTGGAHTFITQDQFAEDLRIQKINIQKMDEEWQQILKERELKDNPVSEDAEAKTEIFS